MANPRSYSVSRSAVIPAEPASVHARINDFVAWQQWSPWEDVDPALTRTYSGPESGVGARYEWSGNRKPGSGSMEIVASTPEQIDIDLQFVKPFAARNPTSFALEAVDAGTRVTWTMTGTHTWLSALMFKVLKMEKALQADFDKGLARLRAALA